MDAPSITILEIAGTSVIHYVDITHIERSGDDKITISYRHGISKSHQTITIDLDDTSLRDLTFFNMMRLWNQNLRSLDMGPNIIGKLLTDYINADSSRYIAQIASRLLEQYGIFLTTPQLITEEEKINRILNYNANRPKGESIIDYKLDDFLLFIKDLKNSGVAYRAIFSFLELSD